MPASLALAALLAGTALEDAPKPRPALAERFAAQVSLSSAASPAERALYDEAVRLMLKGETGRALGERLLAAGVSVAVSFSDLEDKGGMAGFDAGAARVTLSRSVLSWKPASGSLRAAEVLAHELLGHVLSHAEAEAAGAGWEANALLSDEVNAYVVGWLVSLEAGWRFLDTGAETLLADRAAFERELHWKQPHYGALLEDGELADPLGALRARRADPRAVGGFVDSLSERLKFLESRPDVLASLVRRRSSPAGAAFAAELAARIERLRLLAPPLPGLQSLQPDGA
ncbi:MAG: hypothetical protein HY928_07480 [Elusimicrobia bacterium]|nr:hypothetical protein [Elusimicrobiota bacterium]